MKKKIIIWILVSLLGIIVIGLLVLPGIAKKYAIEHSKELLGRQIDLDGLKVNYFTGKVRITDFKMFEPNEKDVFVSFDTLLFKLKPFQLFKDEFILQRFYLSGLKTTLVQQDSTFNFDDLIAFHQSNEDTLVTDDTVKSEPFKYQFSNIEFKHTKIEYQNQNIGDTMFIRDLSFFIPYIGWNQEDKSEAGIKFNFENEGYFQSSLSMNPNSGDFSANIEINHLYLGPFYEYTRDFVNLGSLNGQFNTNLTISGNIDYPEKALISGDFDLYDLKTTDERGKPFVDVKHLEGNLKKIDYFNAYYAFDSLVLHDPYFYIEFYDTTINVLEAIDYYSYFPIEEKSKEIASEISMPDTLESPLYYGFNHVRIENGAMDVVDNTTPEPFEYNLSEIALSSDSIYSSADWVNLYSTMILNNRGKLTAELGFYPEDPMELSVNYVITDFLLSDLNIYSRYYMGFPILYGDMYYKSDTKIRKGKLESDNKLIIQNVELGKKRGGLVDLPIKFALFLLKDRHGVINLDIPVRGDLNDPTVRVGKIVWNTVKNLIVKVAAAPFDFLARLISVDPKDIQAIEYGFLDTALTAEHRRQLDLLLELEQKKQGLDIELIYYSDQQKEKQQIAIAEAGKQFEAITKKNYKTDEEAFVEFLKERTNATADSIRIPDLSIQLIPLVTLDSMVVLYENKRRAGLEKYLHAASDSTKIIFSIGDLKSPKNVGSNPQYEVKYSMSSEELSQK